MNNILRLPEKNRRTGRTTRLLQMLQPGDVFYAHNTGSSMYCQELAEKTLGINVGKINEVIRALNISRNTELRLDRPDKVIFDHVCIEIGMIPSWFDLTPFLQRVLESKTHLPNICDWRPNESIPEDYYS